MTLASLCRAQASRRAQEQSLACRDLIPALSDRYRVIAPDLPGFGLTTAPGRESFEYSFDRLAEVIGRFVDALGLDRYALYIFDYGAPTGLRLAMAHPERVTAIVTQNGNAYLEGLSGAWDPWRAYWHDPTASNRDACRAALSDAAIRFQYEHGAPAGRVGPDGYALDQFYMHRPGAQEIQLDLILIYRTNVALYPAFQDFFRSHQPRCWRSGAGTTRSSCRPAPRPSGEIFPTRRCICSIPGTSRSKRTASTSPTASASFWADRYRRERTTRVAAALYGTAMRY